MKLQIDNYDGAGLRDYTGNIDATRTPQVVRKLNQVSELRVSLLSSGPDFVVPAMGARVLMGKLNGQDVFTGFLMEAPIFEYLGWGEQGPAYRYNLVAKSDEAWLDEKRLPDLCPFVNRSAGDALRSITRALIGQAIDMSAVQDLDTLSGYATQPEKTWSQHAAEIATQARANYRVQGGSLSFAPLGQNVYLLGEDDPAFSPQNLKLSTANKIINDVTIIGDLEPQAYVKDYFVGDNLTTRFYLSQSPFQRRVETIFDEEYAGSVLDDTLWTLTDPTRAVSVSGGQLQVAGGSGQDGATTVSLLEAIELAGALTLQHGDVKFSGASSGIIGGLYNQTISAAQCLAGFSIAPSGNQSTIKAVVNGKSAGPAVNTVSGHHYVLTTRIYSLEIFRQSQTFHSSVHQAGGGIGGSPVAADVRIVMDVHEIDPLNPATEVAPSVVLWDGLISGAPGHCTYAPINSTNLQCSVAFTRFLQGVDAEVRSAVPGQDYRTRLVGALKDGAECNLTSNASLEFFSQYVPAANELIQVHYRDGGRATARITSPVSVGEQRRGLDDGVHGTTRRVLLPATRTTADCENAALAILEDSTNSVWSGTYESWSDFLPGGANDIFPGDALAVNAPSRGVTVSALVQEVEIDYRDLNGDHSYYKISFSQGADPSFAFDFEATKASSFPDVPAFANSAVGNSYLPSLTGAEATQVTSTTISVDAGTNALSGGGFEVRWSDAGWGTDNDRNLVGRFATRTFTLPRLSRAQTYYLRQYDASVPPRYSRCTSVLHVDFPL